MDLTVQSSGSHTLYSYGFCTQWCKGRGPQATCWTIFHKASSIIARAKSWSTVPTHIEPLLFSSSLLKLEITISSYQPLCDVGKVCQPRQLNNVPSLQDLIYAEHCITVELFGFRSPLSVPCINPRSAVLLFLWQRESESPPWVVEGMKKASLKPHKSLPLCLPHPPFLPPRLL